MDINSTSPSSELNEKTMQHETTDLECEEITTPAHMSIKARAFSIDAILSRSTEEEPLISPTISETVSLRSTKDDNEIQLTAEMDCKPSDRLGKSTCTLEMTDLWKKFHDLGTEMIITKSGRRMFPSLRVAFANLEPKAHYQVYFDICAVDNKRYRYAYHRSSWLVAGRADPPIPQRCYTHPDGPFLGDALQKQSISFEKVKLTNNVHDKWDYIILNSMHKYQPRVHLIKYEGSLPTVQSLDDLKEMDRKIFLFPETQFIGVTAYQNQLITKLKIDSNPFAKGFRDSARITQIDRESVDLLIKASRHGYPSTSMAQQLINSHLPHDMGSSTFGLSKYPPVMPSLPLFMSQPPISKELFRYYFDQITANADAKAAAKQGSSIQAIQRFHPYNR